MPSDIAAKIYFLISTFLPASKENLNARELTGLGSETLQISLNMYYDAVIQLNNLLIAQWALLGIKDVYWYSKKLKLNALTEKVYETYKELERHLIRPERTDLEPAKTILQIYKDDLVVPSLTFAVLPDYLNEIVENSSK